jgi:hypothetical protein
MSEKKNRAHESRNLSIACSGLCVKRALAGKPELLANGVASMEDTVFRHDLLLVSLELMGLNATVI